MVPGVPGLSCLSVPRAVVEELRRGGDCVTVLPRHMGELTVMEMAWNRDSVTLGPALYKVNNYNMINCYNNITI